MEKKQSYVSKLRPRIGQDIGEMRELFIATVLQVNVRDYTQEEAADWASCGDSPEHWAGLLARNSFIGAFDSQDVLVGFASMNAGGHLHSLFVHKDWQGKGVATALLSEVEGMAREYGVRTVHTEASITARPFFEKRGYRVVKEQRVKANRLYMTNYMMEKEL